MSHPSSPAAHRILCVVGARPNFMKMAPIIAAFDALAPQLSAVLLHTGQHYDVAMNHQYFSALGMRAPDINLEVGSGSHAQQTAEVMRRFEPAMDEVKPSAVLVVGDVNSTLACALVACKRGIPVVHVEAGLRSYDRTMPEEINRVLTDQLSDLLFTTESSAREQLLREGIEGDRIHFVGNVMIDTLLSNLDRAVPASTVAALAGRPHFTDNEQGYALLTLHRPANVDDPAILRSLLETARLIGNRTPLLFPLHPRTRAMIERAGLQSLIDHPGILALPPMGYLEMLGLMRGARVVLTDSGGVQEETTALSVPCITLRENTERPITVEQGSNTIAGVEPSAIMAAYNKVLAGGGKTGRVPLFWDGQAAGRIAHILLRWLQERAGDQP
ncbi:non-hydrolyzing UDP-N-acetylglucosamine 2-epimerase [Duganella sp. P38]|uniref:non-hydrolyzing UDP-N-acetylglucosamine 2-epimerase n=1 Tax=Duganella sp. P38 TaxID=3423949 RepID=UPI003D7B3488